MAMGPFLATKCMAQPELGLELDASTFVSDNPFVIPGNNRESAAIDLAARPYVDWDLDHSTRLEFMGEVGFRQYFRLYGDFVTGFADLRLEHRHNEYLTISGQARYSRDLNSDILTDSVDFAFDSRGVSERSEVRSAVAWSPHATLTLTGDARWQHLSYPSSRLLQTTDAYEVGVSATKQLNARTSVGAQARMTSSHPEITQESSVASFNLTASHQFAEHWNGTIVAGGEWSKPDDPFGSQGDDRVRFNGSLTLCYEPEHASACLRSSVGSEVSGLGGLQREYIVGATVSSRLSEHSTISADFETRKSDPPGTAFSARVLSASCDYEHRLNRNLYFTSRASYLQRKIGDASIGAVVFQIGISIRGARS